MESTKILVVEDEWIVADQLYNDLKQSGYAVSEPVSTGEDAIKSIETDKPDLVIMDVMLQGKMDGVETAEQIYARFDIPVIYLTAYTSSNLLERAKKTRPCSYLVKPFEYSELQCNIEIALHNHKKEKELKERHELLESTVKKTIDAIKDM